MPTLGDNHSSNFAGIILRLSRALLPTSDTFFPTIRWRHCTQLWSAVCNHSLYFISCKYAFDIHDCPMAQRLIAHIETLMCQDVSQQIESPPHITCGARPTDKKTRAMEDRIGNSAPSPPTKQLLRKVFLAGEMVLAKQYIAPTQCEESQGSPCSLHCGTAWEVFATHQLETINGFLCFCLGLDCFFFAQIVNFVAHHL